MFDLLKKKNSLSANLPEIIEDVCITPVKTDDIALRLPSMSIISIADISSLGGVFSSCAAALSAFNNAENFKCLYQAVDKFGKPVTLQHFIKSGATGRYSSGRYNYATKQVAGTGFKPVSPETLAGANFPSMFISIALANISSQLKEITELQESILNFLKDDKKAEEQGNLNFLFNIMADLKFNSSNDVFVSNAHQKAQDIRQTAWKNIIFHRTEVKRTLAKGELFISNLTIDKKVAVLCDVFSQYCLSVYTWCFAYFVETLLLKNFSAENLSSKKDEMQRISDEYEALYKECASKIKAETTKSVEHFAVVGLSKLGSGIVNVLEKAPLQAEKLTATIGKTSRALSEASESQSDKIANSLGTISDCGAAHFISEISNLRMYSNNPVAIFTDGVSLYIGEVA